MNQPIQSSGMNQMNAVSSWRRNWYLHLNQFHIGAPWFAGEMPAIRTQFCS
jgi:hypothetical protein